MSAYIGNFMSVGNEIIGSLLTNSGQMHIVCHPTEKQNGS